MVTTIGPGTPYLTPAMLTQMPLGIAWSTIPSRNATNAQQLAAQMDLCQTATGMVDGYVNTVLRCTYNTETLRCPDYYATIDKSTGEVRAILSRPPVTTVNSVQYTPSSAYPRQWTTVNPGLYEVERPLAGVYGTSSPSDSGEGGQAIMIAPGFASWNLGRNGYRLRIGYSNGWPHCGLTANASPGATTVLVDDCTGWAPTAPGGQGATGVLFDGAVQEAVTCTAASATTGPGTLTLASPLSNGHPPGTMLSTLPGNVRWATALFAAAQALTRGATATTVQSITPGSGGGAKSPIEMASEAELLLQPFRRVI
jgi:hypothetical protein